MESSQADEESFFGCGENFFVINNLLINMVRNLSYRISMLDSFLKHDKHENFFASLILPDNPCYPEIPRWSSGERD